MALGNDDGKKPIIINTGALLAITTPDKSDFDGPLSDPNGDLRRGGMANGLQIEGMGTVTWTFKNPDGTQVRIQGLPLYYVPGAKVRLLSPQRLFDGTNITGNYEGNNDSFHLHIKGCDPLVIKYDDRNSLPIRYATMIGATIEPQMNIALMDDSNHIYTNLFITCLSRIYY